MSGWVEHDQAEVAKHAFRLAMMCSEPHDFGPIRLESGRSLDARLGEDLEMFLNGKFFGATTWEAIHEQYPRVKWRVNLAEIRDAENQRRERYYRRHVSERPRRNRPLTAGSQSRVLMDDEQLSQLFGESFSEEPTDDEDLVSALS